MRGIGKIMRSSLVVLLCAGFGSAASAQDRVGDHAIGNLPRWAQRALHEDAGLGRYELFLGLNPFYVSGDFDGDGQLDVAVQVTEEDSAKRGIIILHREGRAHVIGAGEDFGNGGDDFSWLWEWHTLSPELIPTQPVRGLDVLYIAKPEAAGGLVWWDGERYRWTQWGD